MAMTEKKKKTDYEWKRANKSTISCTMYRADVEAFKAYAAGRGKSVNELLKEYISECLGRPLEKRTGPQKKETAAPPDEYIDTMPE